MFKIILLLLSIGSIPSLFAQSSVGMLAQANALFKQYKEAEALSKYLLVLRAEPDNLEALVPASFLSGREGFRSNDQAEKSRLYHQGMDFAEKAIAMEPNNADVNYVMGVALGRMIQLLPIKGRVEASRDIKKYAEVAIQIDREHSGAWHLLGLWHYGVKDLSGSKLFLISLIYGGMPRASFESAVDCFLKAIHYEDKFIIYHLDLAKAYLKLGRNENARVILEHALTMKPLIPEDPGYLKECRALLVGLK